MHFNLDTTLKNVLSSTHFKQFLSLLNTTKEAATLAEKIPHIGLEKATLILERRNSLGRFVSTRDLIEIEGIKFESLQNLLSFNLNPEEQQKVEALFRSLKATEAELIRASLLTQREEANLLEFLNTVPTKAVLAKTVKGIGTTMAEAIIAHREFLGRFYDYMDVERIEGLGEARMQALLEYVKSNKIETTIGILDRSQPPVRQLLEIIDRAPEALHLRETIPSFTKTDAENIITYRDTEKEITGLEDVLKIKQIGIKKLFKALQYTATTAEKTALDAVQEKLGEIGEEELSVLLKTEEHARLAALRMLEISPSPKAIAQYIDNIDNTTTQRLFETFRADTKPDIYTLTKTEGISASTLEKLFNTAEIHVEPSGEMSNMVLQLIHNILEDKEQSDQWEAELLTIADRTSQLPSLQYIAAALLIINASTLALEIVIEKAGTPLALGVPNTPWALIQTGEFKMGSPENDALAEPDEQPQKDVAITTTYEMLTIPITNAIYHVLMGKETTDAVADLRHPVTNVNWYTAQEVAQKMATFQKRDIRLPTEAEWEHACRAYTDTRFWTGNNLKDVEVAAWTNTTASEKQIVIQKQKNPFQLYDIHGNVWEWTKDPYKAYTADAPVVEEDQRMVLRGGSFLSDPKEARSANRLSAHKDYTAIDAGFRVVRTPSKNNPNLPIPAAHIKNTPFVPGSGLLSGTQVARAYTTMPLLDKIIPVKAPKESPKLLVGIGLDAYLKPQNIVTTIGNPLISGCLYPMPEDTIADPLAVDDPCGDCPCPPCIPQSPATPLLPGEKEVLDELEKNAKQAKKKQDNDEIEKQKKKKAQAEKDKADAEAEKKRRKKDKKYRKRKAAEDQLEADKKRLEKTAEAIERDRKTIEENDKEHSNRDKDLREQEQKARQNGDPNCRGAACQDIKRQRKALSEDRLKNQKAKNDLAKRQQKFQRDVKQHRNNTEQLERAKDRGYGMNKEERATRKAQKRLNALEAEQRSARERIKRLDAKEKQQGGLSPQDKKVRDAYKKYDKRISEAMGDVTEANNAALKEFNALHDKLAKVNAQKDPAKSKALEKAIKKLTKELGRLETLSKKGAINQLHKAVLKQTGANTIAQAKRTLQIQNLSDTNLDTFITNTKTAIASYDVSIALVGKPEAKALGGLKPDERAKHIKKYNEAIEAQKRLKANRDKALEAIDNGKNERQKATNTYDALRQELKRLGHSEFSTANGPNAARIKQLQADARAARTDIDTANNSIQEAQDALRNLNHRVQDNARDILLSGTIGEAAQTFNDILKYNAKLSPFFDAKGEAKPALRQELHRQFALHGRNEQLKARKERLQKAIDSGKAPSGTDAKLLEVAQEQKQIEEQLKGAGWSHTGKKGTLIPNPEDVTGSAFLETFSEASIERRQRKHKEALKKQKEVAEETVRRKTQKARENALKKEAKADTITGSKADNNQQIQEINKALHEQASKEATEARKNTIQKETAILAQNGIVMKRFIEKTTGITESHPLFEAMQSYAGMLGPVLFKALAHREEKNTHDTKTQEKSGAALLERLFTMTNHLLLQTGGYYAATALTLVQKQVTEEFIESVEEDITTIAHNVKKEQRLAELKKAKILQLKQIDETIANYEKLEQDSKARSAHETVTIARVSRAAAEVEKLILQGKPLNIDLELLKIESQINAEITIAQLAGDLKLANRLSSTLVEAQMAMQNALRKQLSIAKSDYKTAERVKDNQDISTALVNSLKTKKAIALALAEAEKDPKKKVTHTHNANVAATLIATNLIDTEEFAEAIEHLKTLPKDFEKAWRAQILQHAFLLMKTKEAALQPNGENDIGATLERWHKLEDKYLNALKEVTTDTNLIRNANLTLAEHRNQAGDREGALTILRKARTSKASRSDKDLALHLIRILLKGKLTNTVVEDVIAALADLKDQPTSHEIDHMATAAILSKLKEEQLKHFRSTVANHTKLHDKRKHTLLFMFDMAVLSKDAKNGLLATELAQRLAAARTTLAKSNLTGDLKDRAEKDLDNFENPLKAFTTEKAIFTVNPTAIAAEQLPKLLFQALNYKDYDFAKTIIKHYGIGTVDTAEKRLKVLYGISKLFAEARKSRKGKSDFTLWSEMFDVTELTAKRLTKTTIKSLTGKLATTIEKGYGPKPEPEDEWWLKTYLSYVGPLGAITVAHDLSKALNRYMSKPSAEALAAETAALTAEKQSAVAQIQALQLITTEIDMMDEDAYNAPFKVSNKRDSLEKELKTLQKDAETFVASITKDTLVSRKTMAEKRAAIMAKQLEVFAWEDQAMRRGEFSYYHSKDYAKLTSPAEVGAAELIDKLYGDKSDLFGEYGLMGELDELLDTTEDTDVSGQWRIRLKKEEIEMTRYRIASLVASGPILDPNHQGIADNAYRKHLQSVILDAEQKRIKSILREYKALIDEDGTDYWDEVQLRYKQRSESIKNTFASNPELKGFLELDKNYSSKSFAFGLLKGLIMMRNMNNDAFSKYIPKGDMDRGIVQIWNLSHSDFFSETLGYKNTNVHALSNIVKRLDAFDLKVGALEVALIAVIRGKALTTAQKELLKAHQLIKEVKDEQGHTVVQLVVPSQIHLGTLDDALNLPEKSVWDNVFNTKSLLETLAIVISGGLLSGLAAAEVGLWATRLNLGRAALLGAEVVTEAAVFTGVSRGVRAAFGEETHKSVHDAAFEIQGIDSNSVKRIRAEKPGVLTEFVHNLVFFGAFKGFSAISGKLSNITGVASRVEKFKNQPWWKPNIDLVVNGANLLSITSSAAMSSGINAVLTGEAITLHGFVQNMIDFPLVHHVNAKVKRTYENARLPQTIQPSKRSQTFNEAPLHKDLKVNAEKLTKWEKALAPLLKQFGKEATLLDASITPDRKAIETLLENAGITLADAAKGDGNYLKRTVDGEFILFVDAEATRIDIINEAFKAQEIDVRDIGLNAPFTRQMEAVIELASWQHLERSLFKNQKPVGRYAVSIGRSLAWHKRLRAIKSGKLPNTIIHGAGEGLLIFGQKPHRASALRKRFKQHLDAKDIAAVNPDLRLTKDDRKDIVKMLDGLDKAEGTVVDIRKDIAKAKTTKAVEQLNAKLDNAIKAYEAKGGDLVVLLTLLRQRLSISKTPEVVAEILKDPAHSFELEPSGPKYFIMETNRSKLRQEIAQAKKKSAAASNKKEANKHNRDVAIKSNELKKQSEELGEQMAYDMVQNHPELKGAELIYVGEGSRVLDLVFIKGERVFIIEAKGGTGKLITKDAFGKRVEQLTFLNIFKTINEMYISGVSNKTSTDLIVRENAEYRMDAVDKILSAMVTNTVELYLATTPWITKKNGQEVAGKGTMNRAVVDVSIFGRFLSGIRSRSGSSISAPVGKLKALRSKPKSNSFPNMGVKP